MNYPIRIAQIMGKMNNGGVEAVIMNYYRALDKNKFQFDFIIDEDSKMPQRDEIEALGGRVIVIPSYSKIFAYKKALTKIFKENNYQIVHANLTTLNVFPLRVAKKCGVPIRISHGHNTIGKGEFLKSCLKIFFRLFSNFYLTNRFACSKHAGDWLFKGKDYVVIPNAIDYEKFIFNQNTRKTIRNQYNISENDLVIGHIGRFNAQKNHEFIVNLFARLSKENKNFRLFLIGEGPEKEKILNMIDELGLDNKVIVINPIANAYDYYNAFDLFILPSQYEGFGNVAIEAEVNKLIVIASDNVPIETKIGTNILYLPLDYGLWQEEINKLELKRHSSDVSDKYDIKLNVNKLEEIYTNLLNLD